jgi:acyl-coenzyme A synthetase/AMP-(fatty) acid ligase
MFPECVISGAKRNSQTHKLILWKTKSESLFDSRYKITGRVDDVLNVCGQRIGTAEVENAIKRHAGVLESAVVGYLHVLQGQDIYAYVIYEGHSED